MDKENWLEYGARCRIEADQQGLIRGRHQLGIKVPADTCPAVIRKWILEGFPKVAHVDDVRHVWIKMVLMKSKFWKKSKKSTHIVWTFNAKRDDREEIIQSCVVDEEGVSYDVVMPRAVKTRRVQSKSTPLRNPKTLGRTAGRQRPPSIAANDKEQETEMWDHEEDEAILEWNGPRDSAPVKTSTPRTPAPGDQLSLSCFP